MLSGTHACLTYKKKKKDYHLKTARMIFIIIHLAVEEIT